MFLEIYVASKDFWSSGLYVHSFWNIGDIFYSQCPSKPQFNLFIVFITQFVPSIIFGLQVVFSILFGAQIDHFMVSSILYSFQCPR